MPKTLQHHIYRQLEKSPQQKALAFINSRSEFRWQTLEKTLRAAAASGARLRDLGLGRGDVCFIVLPSDESCARLLLATLLLGAVPLLMAPPTIHVRGRYSNLTEILKHVIRKIKPRVALFPEEMALIENDLAPNFKRTRFVFGPAPFVEEASAVLEPTFPRETDIAGFQLTSGTTGFPRVCVWEQRKVIEAIDCMVRAMELNRNDICFNWTPLYHDMGLVNNFFLSLSQGVPLAMLNPLDFVRKPSLWLKGLSDTGSTLTWAPNFGFAVTAERVKEEEIKGISLNRVRAFWNAAERIHPETIAAFYSRFESFGLRRDALKTAYGLAENIGAATFSDPRSEFVSEQLDRETLQERGVVKPIESPYEDRQTVTIVGVGRPCPGIEIEILGRRGQILPQGQIGEIALKTPSPLTAYLGNAFATRRTLTGDLLRTGDVGYLRGRDLFWVGRRRERITALGKKLDPSDFEQVLLKIKSLRTGCFAVFGVDDVQLGSQRIVVVAEIRDSTDQLHGELRTEIKSKVYLGLGVKIDEVILVPAGTLTKTSSGKRRHLYFRELYLNGELKKLDISMGATNGLERQNAVSNA